MNRAIVRDPLVTADAIDEPVLVAVLNALPGVHVQQADQNEPLLTTPSPNDRWSVPFAIDYSTAGLRTLEFLRWCCQTACPLHGGPCAVELAAHLPDPDHQVAWALREPGIQGRLIGRGVEPKTIAWWLATMWTADTPVYGHSGGPL